MALRNKIYQALATQTIVVSGINALLVMGFPWDLLTMTKIYNISSLILQEQ